MNALDLPVVGPISNDEKDFFGSFAKLARKKILCIGFSTVEIEQLIAKYGPSEIIALTNWTDHADARIEKYRLIIGDITKRTQFPDDSFDAILTLSVLEHLADLDGAFDEMTRLVRDGGEMIHMFGPAWSSAYGHHIYEDANDALLNFSCWKMPAHIHLLCTRDEVIDFYVRMGYPQHAGYVANYWFHEAPLINRVFFDDYMTIFQRDRLQIDRMELMYNKLPSQHLERLRCAYPGRRDFSTYGGKFKLVVWK